MRSNHQTKDLTTIKQLISTSTCSIGWYPLILSFQNHPGEPGSFCLGKRTALSIPLWNRIYTVVPSRYQLLFQFIQLVRYTWHKPQFDQLCSPQLVIPNCCFPLGPGDSSIFPGSYVPCTSKYMSIYIPWLEKWGPISFRSFTQRLACSWGCSKTTSFLSESPKVVWTLVFHTHEAHERIIPEHIEYGHFTKKIIVKMESFWRINFLQGPAIRPYNGKQ